MDNRWVRYQNGNYIVLLDLKTGTKVRWNCDKDNFVADFPECIDVTITNKCSQGCPMCYAGCVSNGRCPDLLNAPWISKVHSGTEFAIGGGNIFEHPQLYPFLRMLSSRGIIANITVNQAHFMEHLDEIRKWSDERLVYGIGVSVFEPIEELLTAMSSVKNTVAHCIVGILTPDMIYRMSDHDINLLLLGYKTTGRGEHYLTSNSNSIQANTAALEHILGEQLIEDSFVSKFRAVSFDNLALKQLHIKNKLTEERWQQFYMGDDGVDGELTSASMYIDMVSNTYAVNSMTGQLERYPISRDDSPTTMYQTLKAQMLNRTMVPE